MRPRNLKKLSIKQSFIMFVIATGINITYAQGNAATAANLQETSEGCYEEPDTLSAQYENLDELVVSVKKEVVKSDGSSLMTSSKSLRPKGVPYLMFCGKYLW